MNKFGNSRWLSVFFGNFRDIYIGLMHQATCRIRLHYATVPFTELYLSLVGIMAQKMHNEVFLKYF